MQTTSPRNVFVVAYYFPPMGLSGVQRTLKFVKYLPQFGWQPTVLTVTPTGYFAQDYTLLEEINPLHIEIRRVGSLDPNRLFRKKGVVKMPSERLRKVFTYVSDMFFIPDNKIGWKRKALNAAEEMFARNKFEVIFATAPPFTDFLIGMELSKKFKIPLVVDYRDPWLEYPFKYYPTSLHKWRNFVLESSVLHAASRIIATNRRVKEMILQRHKFLNYKDVTILPQGFDPQDFCLAPGQVKSNKFKITHAGVFYGDRTPKYFLQALKKVVTERPDIGKQLEACFIGNIHDEHLKLIKSLHLEEYVVTTGYLDHARCVQHLMTSDVLWLMLKNDSQSPGKLYEYFGARKPILACIPDGFLRQTIEEAEAGIIVLPDGVEGITRALLTFYEQYKTQTLPRPSEDIVKKYDRVELTDELSKIFGFLVE
ncbi:MAG TPA: glycosyltransferase [Bacteroidota bacterium]|nr:glycosyltransferase [Bacteroidota bacterium]